MLDSLGNQALFVSGDRLVVTQPVTQPCGAAPVKATDEYLYERGENQIKYGRCRIPADVRAAYPSSLTHITQSLGTSDLRETKSRVRAELARCEEEFE